MKIHQRIFSSNKVLIRQLGDGSLVLAFSRAFFCISWSPSVDGVCSVLITINFFLRCQQAAIFGAVQMFSLVFLVYQQQKLFPAQVCFSFVSISAKFPVISPPENISFHVLVATGDVNDFTALTRRSSTRIKKTSRNHRQTEIPFPRMYERLLTMQVKFHT